MAADSTGKASPGSPIKTLPARIWNNMVDAGRAFADGQLSSPAPGATRMRSTDVIKLQNSSGSDRRKGEILRVGSSVITDITDENIWLEGLGITEDCRFGILKEPAEASSVISAQVSGVCIALVDVSDTGHAYAVAAVGDHVLHSADAGPLEILYAPGTGEQECVVRFLRRATSGAAGVGCGPCVTGAGAMTIDLGSGFMASEAYQATLFCENIDPIIYSDYSGGVWTGTGDPMTLDCNGTTVSWTSNLTYTTYTPGGVIVAWTDGTDTWRWKNRTSFQPGLRTELELYDGPAVCPCAPFVDFPCLVPIPTPA